MPWHRNKIDCIRRTESEILALLPILTRAKPRQLNESFFIQARLINWATLMKGPQLLIGWPRRKKEVSPLYRQQLPPFGHQKLVPFPVLKLGLISLILRVTSTLRPRLKGLCVFWMAA